MGKTAGGSGRLLRVLLRDQYICRLCFYPIDRGSGSVDHIIPTSWGGPSAIWNLRAAHARCNAHRGDAQPDSYPLACNLANGTRFTPEQFLEAAAEIIHTYRQTHEERFAVLRKFNIR